MSWTREQLKERAARDGWTHEQIAERIGITRQTVTDTLAGRSRGTSTRRLIAMTVGVDPDRVDWGDE